MVTMLTPDELAKAKRAILRLKGPNTARVVLKVRQLTGKPRPLEAGSGKSTQPPVDLHLRHYPTSMRRGCCGFGHPNFLHKS